MSEYTLHPEAFTDLDDIRKHIAEDNPDTADQVITGIFDAIRILVQFPHQGAVRPLGSANIIRQDRGDHRANPCLLTFIDEMVRFSARSLAVV